MTPRSQLSLRAASFAIAAVITNLAGAAAANERASVTVREGSLLGINADGIERFLAIPYAAPPVGDLRWKEPVEPQAWQGQRDAREYGPACPQAGPRGELVSPMSEDCLTLNIWTPQKRSGPLPVMVWIHGGGHMWGSGSQPTFDGTEFAKKGVVLVTINYRLGVLGFMAHPDLTAESPHHTSGNYGILDQIQALKWIKANIAQFGGDPGNVTIFGESAGAGAVNILQASPLAAGLFDRAIGESTSQMDPDAGMVGRKDLGSAGQYGAEFGDKLGAESIAELRALPVKKLLSIPTFFWPTERDNYVLPDLVYNIFAKGAQNDVPTLVGSNSMEGSTLRREWIVPAEAEKAALDDLYAGSAVVLAQSATDAVQWQMRSWAALQAKTGKQKSWLYWFDQPWPGRKELGSFHGAEIVYVFQTLNAEGQPWTEDDRKVSSLISDYWVNFARSGDPNGPNVPHWPAYNDADPQLILIGPEPRVISTPRPEAQQFLDEFLDKRR